jgi:hypothetical protein
MTDDATVEAARAVADAVLARAHADESFRAQLLADPVGVLSDAGIDPAAAEQFAGEITAVDGVDVSGFQKCDWGTCWVTICNFQTGTGEQNSDWCVGRSVGGVRG